MNEKTLFNQERIRELAGHMSLLPQPPTQRLDVFTKGLYIRNLRMPAGGCFVTEKHLSEHPYNILSGKLRIWTPETDEWKDALAPGFGITLPGTQRLFIIEKEVLWQTIHPTEIHPVNDSREAFDEAVAKITHLIIEHVDYTKYLPESDNSTGQLIQFGLQGRFFNNGTQQNYCKVKEVSV